MPDAIQQLPPDEANAMLFLAGELSPKDREDFERRLANDAALTTKVEELRGLEEAVFSAIDKLDAGSPTGVNKSASVRQVSRAMQQWTVDGARLTSAGDSQRKILRFPKWAYPVTAAAVIIVGFFVWSTNRPIGDTPGSPEADQRDTQDNLYNQPIPSDNPRADFYANMLERSFSGASETNDTNGDLARLKEVEGEVVAVADGQTGPAIFDDESTSAGDHQ